MEQQTSKAHRVWQPSDYRCQYCIKRAIIRQAGLNLCADHAETEEAPSYLAGLAK